MSSARPPPHPVIDRLLNHVRKVSTDSNFSVENVNLDPSTVKKAFISGSLAVLQLAIFVYDFITYPIYYLVSRPWLKMEVANRQRARVFEVDGNSISVRAPFMTFKALDDFRSAKIQTMDTCFRYAVNLFGPSRALGTRQVLSEEEELQPNGKYFHKLVMGQYEWMSYDELDAKSTSFGIGLRKLGLDPHTRIAIFAETKSEWMIAAIACFKQNFPLVTLYANLGSDAIAYGLNETEVTHVITNFDLMPKFTTVLAKTLSVTHLIYIESPLGSAPDSHSKYRDGVQITAFHDVIELGKTANDVHLSMSPPSPLDPAIIMYTSGSTGMPKGVILPHESLIATIEAFFFVVENPCPKEIYLGYLPLAHILELLSEMTMLLQGVPVGYSSPNTMIDKSTKIKTGEQGDCSVLKPTLMCAVPLVIDRVYKGIQENVKQKGAFFERLIDFCYDYKSYYLRHGMATPLLDLLIFKKMRALLGGRIRFMLSGGAPLSRTTHDYVRCVLGLPLVQGYGLTETCACACVMDVHDLSTGRVGPPLQGVQIRLINWEEGSYRVTDKPRPRGEIVVGGKNVALGYFRSPDQTATEFTTDSAGVRWFKTGDIGELFEDGTLAIIDRKKDLVKLQFGEYVSLAKVESVLKLSPIVDNMCIYGDPQQTFCVALVVVDEKNLRQLAAEIRPDLYGLADSNGSVGPANILPPLSTLCRDRRITRHVLLDVCAHGKKLGLERFELPAAVTLLAEPWIPESGLVTAAFKLKRQNIYKRFRSELDDMYANGAGTNGH